MKKIAIEWTDRDGRHHLKILTEFSANKYMRHLKSQGIQVLQYAT